MQTDSNVTHVSLISVITDISNSFLSVAGLIFVADIRTHPSKSSSVIFVLDLDFKFFV